MAHVEVLGGEDLNEELGEEVRTDSGRQAPGPRVDEPADKDPPPAPPPSSDHRPTPPPKDAGGTGQDPLLRLLFDPAFVKLASTLIARLELIRYNETRRGVFRTPWGRQLFDAGMRRLLMRQVDGAAPAFDVDAWFNDVIERAPAPRHKFDISPSKFAQDVDTNWVLAVLEVESRVSGFAMLLHNTLEIEDASHGKMADMAKKEQEYDFTNIGARNRAMLSIAGPARPTGAQSQPLLTWQKKHK